MNEPYDWVFHPETGTFKNEPLTERVRKAAAEADKTLRPDYDEPIPATEDAGWHFCYDGRLADIRDESSLAAFFPFVRYAEGQGRRGELRAMIPTNLGARKVLAWYVPRVA